MTELWLVALVVVNALDAGLTIHALKLGATELNPLLRLLMRKLPAVLALALTKGVLIVAAVLMRDQIERELPYIVAFFAAICIWNAVQILRLRKAQLD